MAAPSESKSLISVDRQALLTELGKERLIEMLEQMLLIRNFEIRAEEAYRHGKVGGFLHVYSGQEAIAVGAAAALGPNDWWVGTYRCHAYALLLGATPQEVMAELFGRATGNALGRGGSMHLYTDRLLGGFGIVGGHLPIACGAAFSAKYRGSDEITICFLGDGAVAQGAFHEALNLAALWNLPVLFVIENNQWGMGTAVERAIAAEPMAERQAYSYGINGYSCDGMDLLTTYGAFKQLRAEVVETSRPVIVEMVVQRFRGHSVSDPGLYRTKEELQEIMQRDPLVLLSQELQQQKWLDSDQYKAMNRKARQIALDSMEYADNQPWPDVATLEEGVFAP
jgi:pyruvate dehydrogenase E1 component alpha subunit